jgi:molybdopterin synthase sulfur carrier subunit
VAGTVRVLYFAWLRERIGKSEEVLSLPPDVTTVARLLRWLCEQGPEYASAFEQSDVIRAAVDQTHVKPEASIVGAREIAFFPPVTGG